MSTSRIDETTSWVEEAEEDVRDLVVRLQAGERSALAEAYDRHHAELRRFARRLVADDQASEDLVQDVFLALPKAIRRFEGRSTLRTFLVSVALNHCRHHVRAAARRRAAAERMARLEAPEPPVVPAERWHQRQIAELVARGLDRLPLDQRVAFVLCAIEERSSHEAAALVGVSETTVRTRLLRARRKLQAFLAERGVR